MADIKRIVVRDKQGNVAEAYAWRYRDADGQWRRIQAPTKKKLEEKKRALEQRLMRGEVRGSARPDTIGDLLDTWYEATRRGRNGRYPPGRSTLEAYEVQIRLHLKPMMIDGQALETIRVAALTDDQAAAVRDALIDKLSRINAKKCLMILRSAFTSAVKQRLRKETPFLDVAIYGSGRHERPVAVDQIPSREDLRKILAFAAAPVRYVSLRGHPPISVTLMASERRQWAMRHAMLLTAAISGARASELRGAFEEDIDFKSGHWQVQRRADAWGNLGPLKSASAYRTITLPPAVLIELRKWLLQRPKQGKLDWEAGFRPQHGRLLFCNEEGHVLDKTAVLSRAWYAACEGAGIMRPRHDAKPNAAGKIPLRPSYDFHSLRHYFASEQIARGASPKELQVALGHSTIQVTFDVYGHLFKFHEEAARQRAAASAANLLG